MVVIGPALDNTHRVRRNLDLLAAVVQVIGSPTAPADIEGLRRVFVETAGTGGSVYDWATAAGVLYPSLRSLFR
ncbi:hypothetical protein HC251_14135 [Iamia sp. SCSIO 61187]|uniref:hypothetical protein n=1 Tax=Iamia sp. SCSIO 61187 TaxID=2722752 RepID=UPI001C636896|nr:hypothetical protein [Iamia sp. SCSIO 61187]QYG93448.1 hypothetical protein HC251_14135 [Iamia sp. SCSIO 61187]